MDRRCCRPSRWRPRPQGGSAASGALAALPDLAPAFEREGALRLTDAERGARLGKSAATIDRRRAERRRMPRPCGGATTKPGRLLKSQIPVRTTTPWDEQAPGGVEIDLVAYCGPTTAVECAA